TFYMLANALALLFTAGGQVQFKHYYTSRRRQDLLSALAMFGLVPVINFVALRGLPFGFVFILTAITPVLVLLICWFFLGEKLQRSALPGIALILAGIIVYAL